MTSTPIDLARGFLPSSDPLKCLPEPFGSWDEIGYELPKLLAAGRAREVLSRIPALDPNDLPERALPRAMLLLSLFGHAYVDQSWRSEPDAATDARKLRSVHLLPPRQTVHPRLAAAPGHLRRCAGVRRLSARVLRRNRRAEHDCAMPGRGAGGPAQARRASGISGRNAP